MAIESQPAPAAAGLFQTYHPLPGVYDEAQDENGQPRSHWAHFTRSTGRFHWEEWQGRREALRRLRRDFGSADQPGEKRRYYFGPDLDLVPLLISPEEWQRLEGGLRQRAHLFDLVMRDCLGPRRLLAEGALPPALLYANPAFLRPCASLGNQPGPGLSFMACDLVRDTSGRWWVLNDYTRSPHGAGPALQNRLALSRVLPGEFRDAQVRRLAEFFQSQRDMLRGLAPNRQEYPNVVLLTPGPFNAAWPEHVFLARYLGFTLVEGADLTVRDRRVFIKTLEGLQRVEVIFRFLEDSLCDPLELRADSVLGVPGLLEAIRGDQVTVANLPGSAMMEASAWYPFLPSLCRRLLGTDPELPSLETWWCGQPEGMAHTLERLDTHVVRPAFPGLPHRVIWPQNLTADRRKKLVRSIQENPYQYCCQAILKTATAPSLAEGRLEPREYVLRVFMTAARGDWTVMPGGIVQLLDQEEDTGVPIPSGVTKDTWIVSTASVPPVTLLSPAGQIVRLERNPSQVPSRSADNLFWLGRYAERLEDMIRVYRCVLARLADQTGNEMGQELAALARLLVHLDLLPARFQQPASLQSLENEILQRVYQSHTQGTAREVLARLRQLAFFLRDRFSGDTWRILAKLGEEPSTLAKGAQAAQALAYLNQLIVHLAAFSGMEMENMTRGHGWRFLDIGRRLERAINAVTLAQAGLSAEDAYSSPLEAMLEIADSSMTYRRRYFAQPQWLPVLDLLLADETNPRALAFQLAALKEHLQQLPREGHQALPEVRQIELLVELLAGAGLEGMVEARQNAGGSELAEFLPRLAAGLRDISNTLTHRYFSHANTQVN
jgi:uncharacterized circularly permuted ATP-grasp superfamily protein/uncharacterized alpha-E superfamily protein